MSDDGYTRITLRIPDGLHAKLSAEASRTSKSMNSEIIGRLEGSFDHAPTIIKVASLEDRALDELTQKIVEGLKRASRKPGPSKPSGPSRE